MVGSHNLTHNSAVNCEEAIAVTRSKMSVDGFISHFVDLWVVAEKVTPAWVEKTIQDRAERRSRSKSQPVDRGGSEVAMI